MMISIGLVIRCDLLLLLQKQVTDDSSQSMWEVNWPRHLSINATT